MRAGLSARTAKENTRLPVIFLGGCGSGKNLEPRPSHSKGPEWLPGFMLGRPENPAKVESSERHSDALAAASVLSASRSTVKAPLPLAAEPLAPPSASRASYRRSQSDAACGSSWVPSSL